MNPDKRYKIRYGASPAKDSRELNRQREIERWRRLRLIKRLTQVGVVGIILAIAAGYLFAWYLKPRPGNVKIPQVAQDESIRIDRFTYSAPGANPFELEAETATVSDTLDRVSLKSPRVVYNSKEKGKITLTARSGALDKSSGTIRAAGDVEIRMKGLLIKADEVTYSDEERVVTADSRVSMFGEGFSLSGAGLTLFIDTQEARIAKDVTTDLHDVKWARPGRELPI
jgi:LPS export ABC transporter protein LptC